MKTVLSMTITSNHIFVLKTRLTKTAILKKYFNLKDFNSPYNATLLSEIAYQKRRLNGFDVLIKDYQHVFH